MADGQIFGATASGAASGAGMGAQLGSIIPGIGTAAGAGIGALAGGIIGGAKESKSQQSQNIPIVDPTERARLSRLEQISRSLSSGTDAVTQQNIQNQQATGRAAQNAITKSTGGDVGGTLDALLRSQKATQGGTNQAVAQAAQRLPYFDSAAGQMASRIAQRRLELDLLRRGQDLATSTRGRTVSNLNTQALLATQGGTQTIPEGFRQTVPMVKQGVNNIMDMINQMRDNSNKGSFPIKPPTSTPGIAPQPINPSGVSVTDQGFVNFEEPDYVGAISNLPPFIPNM
jgi:hypothetical protein